MLFSGQQFRLKLTRIEGDNDNAYQSHYLAEMNKLQQEPECSSSIHTSTKAQLKPLKMAPRTLSAGAGSLLTGTTPPPPQISPSITPINGRGANGRMMLENFGDELRCRICKNFLQDPMLAMKCLHRFCAGCIQKKSSNGAHKRCPFCNVDLPKDVPFKSDSNFASIIAKLTSNRRQLTRRNALNVMKKDGVDLEFYGGTIRPRSSSSNSSRARPLSPTTQHHVEVFGCLPGPSSTTETPPISSMIFRYSSPTLTQMNGQKNFASFGESSQRQQSSSAAPITKRRRTSQDEDSGIDGSVHSAPTNPSGSLLAQLKGMNSKPSLKNFIQEKPHFPSKTNRKGSIESETNTVISPTVTLSSDTNTVFSGRTLFNGNCPKTTPPPKIVLSSPTANLDFAEKFTSTQKQSPSNLSQNSSIQIPPSTAFKCRDQRLVSPLQAPLLGQRQRLYKEQTKWLELVLWPDGSVYREEALPKSARRPRYIYVPPETTIAHLAEFVLIRVEIESKWKNREEYQVEFCRVEEERNEFDLRVFPQRNLDLLNYLPGLEPLYYQDQQQQEPSSSSASNSSFLLIVKPNRSIPNRSMISLFIRHPFQTLPADKTVQQVREESAEEQQQQSDEQNACRTAPRLVYRFVRRKI